MFDYNAARERRFAMLAMREAGATYKAIGAAYGVCGQAAVRACKRAEYDRSALRPAWANGQDVKLRVMNGVWNEIGKEATREQIVAIPPRQWMRVPNFGKHALRELCELLGYEWWPGLAGSDSWVRAEPSPPPEDEDVAMVRLHQGAERFGDDDCLRISRMAKAWAEIEGEASWIGRVQDVLNAVLGKFSEAA